LLGPKSLGEGHLKNRPVFADSYLLPCKNNGTSGSEAPGGANALVRVRLDPGP